MMTLREVIEIELRQHDYDYNDYNAGCLCGVHITWDTYDDHVSDQVTHVVFTWLKEQGITFQKDLVF